MVAKRQQQSVQIADLLAIALRRKWLVLLTATIVALLIFAFGISVQPLYESRAILAIDHGTKPVSFSNDNAEQLEYNLQYTLMNTQRDLLLSNEVLRRAFPHSTLAANPAYARDPIDVLRSRLRVTTSRDTQVMTVALRDEEPARATRALQAVLTAFIDSEKERQAFRGDDAVSFLSQEVKDSAQSIEQLRAQEQEFQATRGILSTDPDHNFLTEELSELRTKAADLEVRRLASQALVAEVHRADAQPAGQARLQALLSIDAIAMAPAVVEQQRLLTELLTRRVELSQKYLPMHPRMIEIDQMVTAKRQQLEDTVNLVRNGILAEDQQLSEQDRRLQGQISTLEAHLGTYRRNLIGVQMLEDRIRTQEKVHEQLLTKLNEEQVSSRLEQPQVIVVDPPTHSDEPVNIKRLLTAICALGFGAVAGLITPMLVELSEIRLRDPVVAGEITGLPVLAEIPRIDGLLPLDREGGRPWPLAFEEGFRALRTAVRLAQPEDKPCICLLVASASSGEGRSTVAARLAMSLAAIGHFVLLIDGDMRNPSLHRQLGQSNEQGLSSMLAHRGAEASVATVHPHLDFLGVGVRPPNPADLLHRSQFKRLIEDCRANYDYIIIDSPPLDLVSDALAIGAHADGILLVARDSVTSKPALRRVMDRLAPVSAKLLGVVFNGRRHVVPLERKLKYEGRGDIDLANQEVLKVNHELPISPRGARVVRLHGRGVST